MYKFGSFYGVHSLQKILIIFQKNGPGLNTTSATSRRNAWTLTGAGSLRTPGESSPRDPTPVCHHIAIGYTTPAAPAKRSIGSRARQERDDGELLCDWPVGIDSIGRRGPPNLLRVMRRKNPRDDHVRAAMRQRAPFDSPSMVRSTAIRPISDLPSSVHLILPQRYARARTWTNSPSRSY